MLRRARDVVRLTGLAFWRGFHGFYNSDDLTYAASVAYYSLLSLFPFFLLLFTSLGRATTDLAGRNALLDFVLQYFPTQFDFITGQLDSFRDQPLTIGVAGSAALIWGALGVFGAVSTAVNYAWGVEKTRSFWRHKMVSFLMLVVAGLILVVAVIGVSVSQMVNARWFAAVVAQHQSLLVMQSLTVRNATTVLFILVVGLVYYFVPNAKVRFRDVWVGAIVTGLLWKGAFFVFAVYIRDMSRFARVNGSIAAVVIFLLWVYVQAIILLYGAEFTAAYARLRRGRPDEVPAAPAPRTGL